MKRYIFLLAGSLVFLGVNVNAQTQNKNRDKKLNEYDEIIIKRKGSDKDTKLTVEINDDKVLINGKPIDDFVNDDVSVRLRSANHFRLDAPGSPFRQQQGWINDGEEHPFLGVSTEGTAGGARIIVVSENSAAAKAGLQKGDIITKINDKEVFDHEQITDMIGEMKPDDKVTITYKRDGKENKTTATLGKRANDITFGGPDFPMAPFPPSAPMPPMQFDMDGNFFNLSASKPRLGIKVQDLEEGGVKVVGVDEESPAAKAGIKENDIILSLDGQEFNSADELARASKALKNKSTVKLQIKRDGKTQSIDVKLPKKLKTAEL